MQKRKKRVVMAKITTWDQHDRSFDLEFWEKVGSEGKFVAAWQMVCEAPLWKGKHASQSRLQRSVASLKRRED